ncbi:MAG: methytransferase partner Trm112 [Candidatus Thermoplasmatota archaeon]|nr:methytransferase partner Trm112 [Candidatus Thermoplasmatota archaeon]MBS3802086.1 methytransferase partner Trm112 [Candidatus Thermoplasmatota archaeon]
MKKEMMNILCCPTCKSSLQLQVNEEKNKEVISGSLKCVKCKKTYPITDGIPDFVTEVKSK